MARGVRGKKADPLDGAQYWKQGAKPSDYIMDPVTGKRPGEVAVPYGRSTTTLEHTLSHVTLPPRSIWVEGHWLLDWADYDVNGDDKDQDRDLRTWVTSGEGTPGNFIERHYVVPEDISVSPEPKHPKDWPTGTFKKQSSWRTSYTPPEKKTTTKTTAPALPFGIRFRCPACGHWFKEGDLAGHAKVCPGQQEGESDWAIACECCMSLDETAKCKKGFPRPKPKAAAAPPKTKDGDPTYKPEPETLPATFDKENKPGEPLKETPVKEPIKGREGGKGGNGTPTT